MALYELSPPAKAALTCMLIAAIVVFTLGEVLLVRTYRTVDGHPGLSIDDMAQHFTHGSKSLFEARIRTDMREHVSQEELARLLAWARMGAGRKEYQQGISALLDERCVSCHDEGGVASFRRLDRYEDVAATVRLPPTPPFTWMVTTTKIHLVGLAVLLAVPSLMIAGSVLPLRAQAALVWAAYGGLAADFGFWWLMRFSPTFAVGRAIGHVSLVGAFFLLAFFALHGMWFGRRPRA